MLLIRIYIIIIHNYVHTHIYIYIQIFIHINKPMNINRIDFVLIIIRYLELLTKLRHLKHT